MNDFHRTNQENERRRAKYAILFLLVLTLLIPIASVGFEVSAQSVIEAKTSLEQSEIQTKSAETSPLSENERPESGLTAEFVKHFQIAGIAGLMLLPIFIWRLRKDMNTSLQAQNADSPDDPVTLTNDTVGFVNRIFKNINIGRISFILGFAAGGLIIFSLWNLAQAYPYSESYESNILSLESHWPFWLSIGLICISLSLLMFVRLRRVGRFLFAAWSPITLPLGLFLLVIVTLLERKPLIGLIVGFLLPICSFVMLVLGLIMCTFLPNGFWKRTSDSVLSLDR